MALWPVGNCELLELRAVLAPCHPAFPTGLHGGLDPYSTRYLDEQSVANLPGPTRLLQCPEKRASNLRIARVRSNVFPAVGVRLRECHRRNTIRREREVYEEHQDGADDDSGHDGLLLFQETVSSGRSGCSRCEIAGDLRHRNRNFYAQSQQQFSMNKTQESTFRGGTYDSTIHHKVYFVKLLDTL